MSRKSWYGNCETFGKLKFVLLDVVYEAWREWNHGFVNIVVRLFGFITHDSVLSFQFCSMFFFLRPRDPFVVNAFGIPSRF